MKLTQLLILSLALASAAANEPIFVGAVDPPAPAIKVVQFTNRVVSITNAAGKVYENIRLERAEVPGLIYSVTNGLGGGRILLPDLTRETLDLLGIPVSMQESASARKTQSEKARLDAAQRAVAAQFKAEHAKLLADIKDAVTQSIGPDKCFLKFQYTSTILTLDVGLPFYGLPYDGKVNMVRGALVYARSLEPKCTYADIRNGYTNERVGYFSEELGLHLDK